MTSAVQGLKSWQLIGWKKPSFQLIRTNIRNKITSFKTKQLSARALIPDRGSPQGAFRRHRVCHTAGAWRCTTEHVCACARVCAVCVCVRVCPCVVCVHKHSGDNVSVSAISLGNQLSHHGREVGSQTPSQGPCWCPDLCPQASPSGQSPRLSLSEPLHWRPLPFPICLEDARGGPQHGCLGEALCTPLVLRAAMGCG